MGIRIVCPDCGRWLLNQPDHTTASIRETAVMRAVHAATCPTPPTERPQQ